MSAALDRDAAGEVRATCHCLARGRTRIKRGLRIWPNHTPGSMSIRWATVHFGVMGSPNVYHAV
ncbi:MAG TPA: hypothetical protein VE844_03405, partial [Gammaproteobacteria bacterium]|nr:hypothetical protein [Gammaproteobacteria bacterium]